MLPGAASHVPVPGTFKRRLASGTVRQAARAVVTLSFAVAGCCHDCTYALREVPCVPLTTSPLAD